VLERLASAPRLCRSENASTRGSGVDGDGGDGPVVLTTDKVSGGAALIRRSPSRRLKAEPRLGLTLSWPRITSAFLIDVAVLVVARHFPGRTADRRVVGGCRGRGGGDDRPGTRLP
jgi:hypothetical protein